MLVISVCGSLKSGWGNANRKKNAVLYCDLIVATLDGNAHVIVHISSVSLFFSSRAEA